MREVYADVVLKGAAGTKSMRLLVNTGSTFTWIHSKVLRALGILPLGRDSFETIENRVATRRIGEAVLEYEGDARTTIVVFARPGDGEVLGLYALEGLGLEVDPRGRRLRKRARLLAM